MTESQVIKHAKYKSYISSAPNKKGLLNLTQDMGENYIFEFDSFTDRDACRDFVAMAIAPSSEQISTSEIDRMIKLLKVDSELNKLHKELVIGGVLTEAEFWAIRKKKLLDEKFIKQRVGLKSGMIFNVKPSSDGRVVKYNLTRQIIHQILSEKPAVRSAYLNLVPKTMTEMDFWIKFLRAEYLYSTKDFGTAAAEAAQDEELVVFLKQDDVLANEAQRKIRRGLSRNVSKYSQYDLFNNRSFLQDINRHAVVVLEGRSVDIELGDTRSVAEALTRFKQVESANEASNTHMEQGHSHLISLMVELEDLRGPRDHHTVAPLSIKDSRHYFDSQQANAVTDSQSGSKRVLNARDAYRYLRKSISDLKALGFTVASADGEEPQTCIFAYISNDKPAFVSCVDDERLEFQDEDLVAFSEVRGMTELNDGKPHKIINARPYSFTLEDTTNFQAYGGRIVTQIKQLKVLEFEPLKEALKDPGEHLLSDFSKFHMPPLLHLAFQALDKFESELGRLPVVGSEEDAHKLVSIAGNINETLEHEKVDDLNRKLLRHFAFGSRAVLNPMAAMFGGIVGQEVMKSCSGKFHPLFQVLLSNRVCCRGAKLAGVSFGNG
ncbi:hypothetical protein POM88_000973 [Heracleum sosnowskyi]|uniref:BSD domain-containing protein n=1 Tax=Heracleum sosnowskyi TaxID=360622 RepID=A0AAD8JE13_9APIA|nr:hypothetical protein POM88_000973 [Heracleum sosnowskyi]